MCLEEISHHPTISKGVYAVEVVLNFYNPLVYRHQKLHSHYAQESERQINMYKGATLWEFSDIFKEAVLEMIVRVKELAVTLCRLLSGERSEEDKHYQSRTGENPPPVPRTAPTAGLTFAKR